jgi:hypothetical protein
MHHRDHLLLGTRIMFFMVNGSGSLTIVDIYYENEISFIEFVSLGKVYNNTWWGEPLKVNFVNYD